MGFRKLRGLRMLMVVLAVALGGAPAAFAAPKQPQPVPSLTPKATKKLWTKLVHQQHTFSLKAALGCRSARVVLYTESDWLRLATKLAANPSPCAQYYISIPPLAADKTKFRYDQPWRIRALGPQFHVLAEINFTGWSNWVAANNSTFFEAGLEARRRMAANGFDVPSGDSWALNELSSAVRKNTGVARQKARDLLRGLYSGDGTVPQVKGVAFDIGIDQGTGDLAPYKVTLQDWYGDGAFWQDMSAYVSDWSQELYGDARLYGVPGSSPQTRRDHLNDFLAHQVALANIAPDSASAAKSFLTSASTPLANAAWIWSASFGFTSIPVAQMQDYVSGQVYALRSYDARAGLPQDRIGFAWAPRMADGSAWTTTYNQESGALLDRLAQAIRDSGNDSSEPGFGACGTAWCTAAVDGSTAFTESWKTFATWSPTALGFTSAPVSITAGNASAPVTVQLQTAGVADPDANAVTVTLATSSSGGGFSTSSTGPWTSTLAVTIPAGTTASPAVYYRDTKAGTATLTASATGRQSATQTATIAAGPVATVTVTPANASVPYRATQAFTANGADAFGNATPVTATWTLSNTALGTVAANGATGTFTAGSTAGTGTLTAAVATASGNATASATITVKSPVVRASSIAYRLDTNGRLIVTVTAVNASTGTAVAGANVSLAIYVGSALFAQGSGATGADGRLTLTSYSKAYNGCYKTTVRSITASGYSWDGVTPPNQYCR